MYWFRGLQITKYRRKKHIYNYVLVYELDRLFL